MEKDKAARRQRTPRPTLPGCAGGVLPEAVDCMCLPANRAGAVLAGTVKHSAPACKTPLRQSGQLGVSLPNGVR